jgi:hypothetical protein
MEIIGYISALLIGISLGLIGSGGTILTLPILVYLFKVPTVEATHYSLFIVGATAASGTYQKFREKFVDVRTAIYFLIPSIIAVYLTRQFILPNLPTMFFGSITKDVFLLALFAVVMLFASISMIRSSRVPDTDCFSKTAEPGANPIQTSAAALGVGVLTGLLGAGGGFLIVPTLILLKGHCMRRATGTSLLIITINSLLGFVSDINANVNWSLVVIFTIIACIGMLIGIKLSNKIDGAKLKRLFGIFVLAMGTFILIKELLIR